MKHKWKMDGKEIDIFAGGDGDFHNGPKCVRCGQGFCHHCHRECYTEQCSPKKKKIKGYDDKNLSPAIVAMFRR
jgi:hypothetical protein